MGMRNQDKTKGPVPHVGERRTKIASELAED